MVRVVIVGGGFAGCAAAVSARRAGAEVVLVERLEEVLGTGLAGGVMRNNGRYTATEEAIVLGGGGSLFTLVDSVCRHRDLVGFPGHAHPWVYDRLHLEPVVRRYLIELGVTLRLESRMVDVERAGDAVSGIILEDGTRLAADAFVDATGTSGPMRLCSRHGMGCVMCILRCPTFGGRVGVAAKAGVEEYAARRADGVLGAVTGAFDVHKDSLAPEFVAKLEREGVVVVPLPSRALGEHPEGYGGEQLSLKTCQQYALPVFAENLVIVDNGFAKVHTPFVPLNVLRRLPGFEGAHVCTPLGGGRGNAVRYLAMAPRDDALRVEGLANVFCAGEKAGPFVGHTEAIVTGSLAGHNAARLAAGAAPQVMPRSTLLGDLIAFVNEQVRTVEGLSTRYTFSGAQYFERMLDLGTYTTDPDAVRRRLHTEGLEGLFDRPVVA